MKGGQIKEAKLKELKIESINSIWLFKLFYIISVTLLLSCSGYPLLTKIINKIPFWGIITKGDQMKEAKLKELKIENMNSFVEILKSKSKWKKNNK